MDVIDVLHMKGGNGDSSYATNSLVQKKVILMTKSITNQAITDLYTANFPESLTIVDHGCSSGPNTFLVVSELIRTVYATCEKLGCTKYPELQIYLNDLPGNDFSSIFQLVPKMRENLKKEIGDSRFGPCFFTGILGSFYDRLFSENSIHFVHSSYSLQWLSRVPELAEINKGNIYMASTSPNSVLKAYYEQFQNDFSQFLDNRAKELVIGGRMVLTILGRKNEDRSSKDGCYIWELMAMAINQMVCEGLIEEEKLDDFNIPQYTPSVSEVKLEVEKQRQFSIEHLEISEVDWNVYASEEYRTSDRIRVGGYNVAKYMRAVAEPLLVSQFGDNVIDDIFSRYQEIVTSFMAKEETKFYNVIVSLTKKR